MALRKYELPVEKLRCSGVNHKGYSTDHHYKQRAPHESLDNLALLEYLVTQETTT